MPLTVTWNVPVLPRKSGFWWRSLNGTATSFVPPSERPSSAASISVKT